MKKIETMTPNEIAQILRIHPFTVTRLARKAHSPASPPKADPPILVAEKSAASACPPGFVAGHFRKDQFE